MRNAAIVGSVVLLLLGGGLWVQRAVDAQRPQGSDEEQLRRMLYEGERAAEQRNAAGVNRFLSEDYRDGLGMSDSSLKYQIRQYLSRRRAIDVVIPSERVQVYIAPDGATGTVTFPMAVLAPGASQSAGAGPAAASIPASQMTLTLGVRKERVHYFLVFPGEEWRVVSAEGYDAGAFE